MSKRVNNRRRGRGVKRPVGYLRAGKPESTVIGRFWHRMDKIVRLQKAANLARAADRQERQH